MTMRTAVLLLIVALAAPATAQDRLTEAEVRAFTERQVRAWNAGDLPAFFATFAPSAVFVEQARTREGEVVPYGRSTLKEARAQLRRFLGKSSASKQSEILAVRVSPNGRGAGVVARDVSRIETQGKVRTYCSLSVQGVYRRNGRLVSTGQTETIVPCAP